MQSLNIWPTETGDRMNQQYRCRHLYIDAHRAREFFHQHTELRTELASDAEKRQLSDVLRFRSLENGLDQRTLAFHDENFQGRMQRVVVLLDELCLQRNNAEDEVLHDLTTVHVLEGIMEMEIWKDSGMEGRMDGFSKGK